MKRAMAVVIVLAAPAAWADQILLRGGGVVNGEIVEQTASALVVEVGPGRMTLPMSRVARVVSSTSDLTVYRQRAAALSSRDVAGWLALARFAESRDLLTQAREAYEHVLAVDPSNAIANAALDRVLLDGRWVSKEDAYRARGLVSFEGAWVRPDERASILAERAADARTRELALEAEARVREADARARVAEAEARQAEAGAATADGGPYPLVYGGGVYGGGVYGGGVYGGGVVVGNAYPPVYGGVWVGVPGDRRPHHGDRGRTHHGDRAGRRDGRQHPEQVAVPARPPARNTAAPRPRSRAVSPERKR